MIRFWFHHVLLAHRSHRSDMALYRYHCFTCGKRWRMQP